MQDPLQRDAAIEFINREPTYSLRSGGRLCNVCGAIVGGFDRDERTHSRWHATVVSLLATEPRLMS